MGTIMERGIIPALAHLRMNFGLDTAHDAALVPCPALSGGTGTQLLIVAANEQAHEASCYTQLCVAPAPVRPAMALLLARLNARYNAVTFAMTDEGAVILDAHAELAYTERPDAMIALAIVRLRSAMEETGAEIVATLHRRGRSRPTRLAREVSALTARFDTAARAGERDGG